MSSASCWTTLSRLQMKTTMGAAGAGAAAAAGARVAGAVAVVGAGAAGGGGAVAGAAAAAAGGAGAAVEAGAAAGAECRAAQDAAPPRAESEMSAGGRAAAGGERCATTDVAVGAPLAARTVGHDALGPLGDPVRRVFWDAPPPRGKMQHLLHRKLGKSYRER